MLSEEVLHPHSSPQFVAENLLHPLLPPPRPVKLDSNGDKPPPEPPNLTLLNIFLRGQKETGVHKGPQWSQIGAHDLKNEKFADYDCFERSPRMHAWPQSGEKQRISKNILFLCPSGFIMGIIEEPDEQRPVQSESPPVHHPWCI